MDDAATQQLQQQQQQQPVVRHRSTARRLVSLSSRRADTSVSLPNDVVIKPTASSGPGRPALSFRGASIR
ncbi:hypothetical protein BZL30_6470 [Mycobacterium kansasii]|uniref:Uncharacterized protein n=1 Tax=Mycobacterium kansasii TaxID=1768 RepID=A0A1V3WWY0_MYCKA|nr:hypothetical protein BZL30_6470 [Mycobacterium kansasii]